MMNWVTTNIRIPEDIYMDLKMTAARRRTSISKLVQEKLGVEVKSESREDFWKRLDKFAKKMAKKNPGVSLSQKLIEMRYEQ